MYHIFSRSSAIFVPSMFSRIPDPLNPFCKSIIEEQIAANTFFVIDLFRKFRFIASDAIKSHNGGMP